MRTHGGVEISESGGHASETAPESDDESPPAVASDPLDDDVPELPPLLVDELVFVPSSLQPAVAADAAVSETPARTTAEKSGDELTSFHPSGGNVLHAPSNDPGSDANPVWSPDGDRIVFTPTAAGSRTSS